MLARRRWIWWLCSSPLIVAALALIAIAVLNAFGAHCAYPNTPMQLDGTPRCNQLGQTRDNVSWAAWLLVFVSVPVAVVAGVGGLIRSSLASRAKR